MSGWIESLMGPRLMSGSCAIDVWALLTADADVADWRKAGNKRLDPKEEGASGAKQRRLLQPPPIDKSSNLTCLSRIWSMCTIGKPWLRPLCDESGR